jgi:hypothetical protein
MRTQRILDENLRITPFSSRRNPHPPPGGGQALSSDDEFITCRDYD